jgi:hypothetical protein
LPPSVLAFGLASSAPDDKTTLAGDVRGNVEVFDVVPVVEAGLATVDVVLPRGEPDSHHHHHHHHDDDDVVEGKFTVHGVKKTPFGTETIVEGEVVENMREDDEPVNFGSTTFVAQTGNSDQVHFIKSSCPITSVLPTSIVILCKIY